MYGTRTPLVDSPPLKRYGLPELVFAASPAVATDFVQAIPGHDFARLVSVFVRLVTDGNAANREVVIEYRTAEALRYDVMGSAVTQAATLTIDYLFSGFREVVTSLVDATQLIPLHPTILPPTHDFRIHIVNAQVGDQLSRIRFLWERFYTTDQPPTDEP